MFPFSPTRALERGNRESPDLQGHPAPVAAPRTPAGPCDEGHLWTKGAPATFNITHGVWIGAGFSGNRVWSEEKSDSEEIYQRTPKLRRADTGLPVVWMEAEGWASERNEG